MTVRGLEDGYSDRLWYDGRGNGWDWRQEPVLVESAPLTEDEADGHYDEFKALAELSAEEMASLEDWAADRAAPQPALFEFLPPTLALEWAEIRRAA